MRLSEEATKLLSTNQVSKLKGLPFEHLIHPLDLEEYNRHCASPLGKKPTSISVLPNILDLEVMESLRNAVVVSNGYIYSQDAVEALLRTAGPTATTFRCPLTRGSLRIACFGETEPKQSFVRLPQIDAAMDHFRKLQETVSAVAQPLEVATANAMMSPAVEAAITELSIYPFQVLLQLKVSGSKIRVVLASPDRSVLRLLRPFFSAAFNHNEACEAKATDASVTGYRMESFGRCWQVSGEARLDFWFPTNGISDAEVNRLMLALLSPLQLKSDEIPSPTSNGSIHHLAARDYKNALHEPRSVSLQNAAHCCNHFLACTKAITDERNLVLNDKVIYSKSPPLGPAKHSGYMFFGGEAHTTPSSHSFDSTYSSVSNQ